MSDEALDFALFAELVLAQRMTVSRQVDAVVSPLLERVDRIAARVIRLDAGARRRLAFRSGEARQRTIVRMSNMTPIDQAGTRADMTVDQAREAFLSARTRHQRIRFGLTQTSGISTALPHENAAAHPASVGFAARLWISASWTCW